MSKNQSAMLWVEGRDDSCVVQTLLKHYQVKGNFEVLDKSGIDGILKALPQQLKGSALQRLGIVVDADEQLDQRWHRIRTILRDAGLDTVPKAPDPTGTIVHQQGKPRIGVWLMPDNSTSGMLEDFVGFLIRPNDALIDYARRCVRNIAVPERCFRPSYLTKAEIHTWLAWQAEPGTPLGQAITKKYLDPDCDQAAGFITWIQRLFDDQPVTPLPAAIR